MKKKYLKEELYSCNFNWHLTIKEVDILKLENSLLRARLNAQIAVRKDIEVRLEEYKSAWKRMAEQLWHLDPNYLDTIKKIEQNTIKED